MWSNLDLWFLVSLKNAFGESGQLTAQILSTTPRRLVTPIANGDLQAVKLGHSQHARFVALASVDRNPLVLKSEHAPLKLATVRKPRLSTLDKSGPIEESTVGQVGDACGKAPTPWTEMRGGYQWPTSSCRNERQLLLVRQHPHHEHRQVEHPVVAAAHHVTLFHVS